MRSLILFMTVMTVALTATAQAQTTAEAKQRADSLFAAKELKADSLPWKYRAATALGFTNTQLNNWAGGGQDAIAISMLLALEWDYAHEIFSWENDVILGYGLIKQGSQEFRKNDDRLMYVTKTSLRQNEWLRYTGFVDFRTQWYIGRKYDYYDSILQVQDPKISNFIAPAYLTAALGFELTPVKPLKILVSPVGARSVFVLDDELAAQGAFGVAPGENVYALMGSLVNVTLHWSPLEDFTWRSMFNGFGPYQEYDAWIVTLENSFMFKINDWFSVGLLTDVFYDQRVTVSRDDGTVGPATQLRNQLMININYEIKNY